MTGKQILMLAFVGGAVGAAIGFVGTQSIQKKTSIDNTNVTSPTTESVAELADDDFLSSYMEKKKDLPAREQVLGDRLYACLANKELAKKTSEDRDEENAEDSAEKKSATPPTNLVGSVATPTDKSKKTKAEEARRMPRPILAVAARNAEIQQKANQRYLDVFPSTVAKHSEEDNFGVKNNLSGKIQDFLKDNVCNDPKLSTISDDQRSRSKFFESVKENSFRGVTEIFGASAKETQKLSTIMQFGTAENNGMDYIAIKGNRNIMERRSIDPDIASAAWRYNSCGFSVVLVGEGCPWNKKYTSEYKDLFYTPDSKKLIGNIYCKSASDPKWTNVGNIVLSQQGE